MHCEMCGLILKQSHNVLTLEKVDAVGRKTSKKTYILCNSCSEDIKDAMINGHTEIYG